MAIEIGDKRQQELIVTPEIAVYFMKGGAPILGTPFLIYNLEITARNLASPKLDPAFDTVGR